jgi:hypothetical protein
VSFQDREQGNMFTFDGRPTEHEVPPTFEMNWPSRENQDDGIEVIYITIRNK